MEKELARIRKEKKSRKKKGKKQQFFSMTEADIWLQKDCGLRRGRGRVVIGPNGCWQTDHTLQRQRLANRPENKKEENTSKGCKGRGRHIIRSSKNTWTFELLEPTDFTLKEGDIYYIFLPSDDTWLHKSYLSAAGINVPVSWLLLFREASSWWEA